MSFALSLIATLAQVTPATAARLPAIQAALPTDWSALPELRFLRRPPGNPDLSAFVRDEVAAGRCKAGVRSASGTILSIDLVVLVGSGGHVRRIVPRAIDCVAVEQYAAGLASRTARDNIDAAGVTADTWFRTTMTFSW